MARREEVIFTNMCMVYDGERVLVQDRRDPRWQGITFPGGHVEYGESFTDAVIREVYEETGLTIRSHSSVESTTGIGTAPVTWFCFIRPTALRERSVRRRRERSFGPPLTSLPP